MEELLKEVKEIYPDAFIDDEWIYFAEFNMSICGDDYILNNDSCCICESKDKQKILNLIKSFKECE